MTVNNETISCLAPGTLKVVYFGVFHEIHPSYPIFYGSAFRTRIIFRLYEIIGRVLCRYVPDNYYYYPNRSVAGWSLIGFSEVRKNFKSLNVREFLHHFSGRVSRFVHEKSGDDHHLTDRHRLFQVWCWRM